VKNFPSPLVSRHQLFTGVNPATSLSQLESDPHLSAERPLLLWAGNSFPPPNPIPLCASASSHPCSVVFSAKAQHLPKGMAGSSESSEQRQAFADRPEGSCSTAEGEGSRARSRQPPEKYAYGRQKHKQAEKAPRPGSAPLPSACTPWQRGSSPGRLRAPSVLSSRCPRGPLCLHGRPPGPWL